MNFGEVGPRFREQVVHALDVLLQLEQRLARGLARRRVLVRALNLVEARVLRDEVGLDVLRLGFQLLGLKFQARLKNVIRQKYITSDAASCLGEVL